MTRAELSNAEFNAAAEKLAYVRAIRSEDVQRLFPQAPALQPGVQLFALLMGDGTPIMLTETRDAALANALANDLTPVSLH